MRKTILTILALIVMSAQCFAADWVWVESNSNFGYFYDKDSITFALSKDKKIVNRDIIYVWVKFVCDEEYVRQAYERKELNYPTTKVMIGKYGYDLVRNKQQMGTLTYYDKDGKVLWQSHKTDKWTDIIPDSVSENIKSHAAKYARSRTEEIEQRTRGNR